MVAAAGLRRAAVFFLQASGCTCGRDARTTIKSSPRHRPGEAPIPVISTERKLRRSPEDDLCGRSYRRSPKPDLVSVELQVNEDPYVAPPGLLRFITPVPGG